MLNKIYIGIGGFIALSYATMGFMGWELGGESRETVPAEARAKGYRGHTWIVGFRGGK